MKNKYKSNKNNIPAEYLTKNNFGEELDDNYINNTGYAKKIFINLTK